MTRLRMGSAAVALAAVALAACGSDDGGAAPAAGARPRSTGVIKIVRPTPGQVVTGDALTVRVEVTGARVLEQASRDVRPDTGHVHIALDGKTVTLLAGLEYRLTDLTPGPHILQAEFSAADHGPFNPRVIATVSFTVR